jgi:hypothetical protein
VCFLSVVSVETLHVPSLNLISLTKQNLLNYDIWVDCLLSIMEIAMLCLKCDGNCGYWLTYTVQYTYFPHIANICLESSLRILNLKTFWAKSFVPLPQTTEQKLYQISSLIIFAAQNKHSPLVGITLRTPNFKTLSMHFWFVRWWNLLNKTIILPFLVEICKRTSFRISNLKILSMLFCSWTTPNYQVLSDLFHDEIYISIQIFCTLIGIF